MTDLFDYLKERDYPGRGIMLGCTPMGQKTCAYFIMGRSENSRNRIFEKTEDGIRTRAFDESLMTDPSLIIYHPVRRLETREGKVFVVTNGDQTDTIRNAYQHGKNWLDALMSRAFEPDGPNWTPRISGLELPTGETVMSILKSRNGDPECCERFFYTWDTPTLGMGHFISTYQGFGDPIPSFAGDPVEVEVPQEDAQTLANHIWEALNPDNRVSLYVCADGEEVIINKHC